MHQRHRRGALVRHAKVTVIAATVASALMARNATAQDRLKSMPGYDQYQRMSRALPTPLRLSGIATGGWMDGGRTFEFQANGKFYRFDARTKKVAEISAADARQAGTAVAGRPGRGGGAGPARGRQFDSAVSPDGKLKAFYRDRNLWLSDSAGRTEVSITTDGNEKARIKNGSASWVYGEELAQRTAMWWNPAGTKVAYYRFDESGVPDYFLGVDQTKVQSALDVEAYPKAGVTNPVVELFVYDVATKQSTRVDVRDGKPFSNDVVGHYVYNVGWTLDGNELLINRANRRQNTMELAACNPSGGACRVVVHEEWPTGWVENRPTMRFLADGKRFIWESERTGFRNYYLYDLSGKLLATLTKHPFEVAGLVQIDEVKGQLYYMARDGDNHMKLQLHRVRLDGTSEKRLTDPAFNHMVSVSPDGKYFVDVEQTHDRAPVSRVVDGEGKVIAELAKSDLARLDSAGIKRVELFTYKAADSTTVLYGSMHFPSNFDASRKYPVLVSVYGGPASGSNIPTENFTTPNRLTEYGFIVLNLEARSAPGHGKRMLDALYQKLGVTEIDDLAAGVKALYARPYVDRNRVGIFGTSYGGYASAMALLRYPDVFAAASSSSPVTDWRHYDSIYTERYMWIPQENAAGYEAGSAMKYAPNLKGRLMLYFGTADNNVHPSNMMQLVQALQRAGKSFELQMGPDLGHTGLNQDRMMEFFIENLVMKAPSMPAAF